MIAPNHNVSISSSDLEAVSLGKARGIIDEAAESALIGELVATPRLLAEALKLEPTAEKLAQAIARARDVLYLGRGTAYPLALEGAMKLKELSYIHAEGYAAGELKHGPIALIDEPMPVIVIAPRMGYGPIQIRKSLLSQLDLTWVQRQLLSRYRAICLRPGVSLYHGFPILPI
jgi:glucosamine 6-phosphate synthetase-like amidotransferase/phosphosugar isomerase protein